MIFRSCVAPKQLRAPRGSRPTRLLVGASAAARTCRSRAHARKPLCRSFLDIRPTRPACFRPAITPPVFEASANRRGGTGVFWCCGRRVGFISTMADVGAGTGGGGEEDGSVRELDKYLPTANIARIMKKVRLCACDGRVRRACAKAASFAFLFHAIAWVWATRRCGLLEGGRLLVCLRPVNAFALCFFCSVSLPAAWAVTILIGG